jgi:hypothetical protein
MATEAWKDTQLRLMAEFMEGEFGPHKTRALSLVLDQESAYGAAIKKEFNGHETLEISFFDFFAASLELGAKSAFYGQLPKADQEYSFVYLSLLNLFRSMRCASILKDNGYPMRGFAALRDCRDNALFVGAAINGYSKMSSLLGLVDKEGRGAKLSDDEYKKIRREREGVQAAAIQQMIGRDSNLAPEDIGELKRLREMSNEEVHGGRYTFFDDLKTLAVHKRLPSTAPGPHGDLSDVSMYMNRFSETGWMALRVLPYLLLKPKGFDAKWVDHWHLLDGAFQAMNIGLENMGKKVAGAYDRMMASKFSFDPETHYH